MRRYGSQMIVVGENPRRSRSLSVISYAIAWSQFTVVARALVEKGGGKAGPAPLSCLAVCGESLLWDLCRLCGDLVSVTPAAKGASGMASELLAPTFSEARGTRGIMPALTATQSTGTRIDVLGSRGVQGSLVNSFVFEAGDTQRAPRALLIPQASPVVSDIYRRTVLLGAVLVNLDVGHAH